MKKTVATFAEYKKQGKKIVMVTAYDCTIAKLADAAGVDSMLVGDSLGMVSLGYKDTLSVTMDDMVHHTRAVANASPEALIVGDMPFLSYHVSPEEAVRNAGRLIQAGAEAVKLEGGIELIDMVKAIVRAQIPVMGHLGLTPQSINVFGGFKVQGKDIRAAQKLLDDARALEDAGAFSIVLECIPAALAQKITEAVSIPTIGIGAGAGCDGQVLVYADLLGMFGDFRPKFVKVFEDAGSAIKRGIAAYAEAVRDGTFPAQEHTFSINDDVLSKLY